MSDYPKQTTTFDLQDTSDDFNWLIDANTIDDATLGAIARLRQADKTKSRV